MPALNKFEPQRPGLWRYFNTTSWLFGERIFNILVSLIVGIWVTRYLGPENFGLLNFAQSVIFIIAVAASLGLEQIVINRMVHSPEQSGQILGSAIGMRLAVSAVCYLLLIIGLAIIPTREINQVLLLVMGVGLFATAARSIEFLFQARVEGKLYARGQMLGLTLGSLAKIVLILSDAELVAFAIAFVLEQFLIAAALWLEYRHSQRIRDWSVKSVECFEQLKAAWPLLLTAAASVIYMRIDVIMLEIMRTPAEVGHYSAAVRLATAAHFLPILLSTALFPAIIRSRKEDAAELYNQRMQALYDLALWIGIGLAIGFTLFAIPVVDILYGQPYAPSARAAILLSWAIPVIAVSMISNRWYVAEDLQRYGLYCTIFAAITNVILNLLLIPIYGIEGAAIATLLCQVAGTLIVPSLLKPIRQSVFWIIKSLILPSAFLRVYRELFIYRRQNPEPINDL